MEFIIVPGNGLVRAGARLTAVLDSAHDALMLSQRDFGLSALPPSSVGLLYLGGDAIEQMPEPRLNRHGAQWSTAGREVFFRGVEMPDPAVELSLLNTSVSSLTKHASAALESLGPKPSPTQMTGVHLAGLYLSPDLRVPAQTIAAGRFDFTPERMLWERQYTYAVVQFLARGFDEYLGSQA